MSVSKGRSAAREVVTRVREREAFAHETLDSVLRTSGVDERDAAFTSHLALGTIAWRGTLDDAVRRYLKADVRLEPLVADCLAVSAYELLRMRTPARAAVNEGVELVRSVRPRAAGLANAVLRRLAENCQSFPWIEDRGSTEFLAASTGHPLWMAQLFVDDLGRQTAESVLHADNEPSPLFLYVAPDDSGTVESLAAHDVRLEPGPVPHSFEVPDAAQAVRSHALSQTEALVIDAGAQVAARSMPLPSEGAVAELGAGRGTKTLLMAMDARAGDKDVRFTAIDIHEFKLAALRASAGRLCLGNIDTVTADATDLGTAYAGDLLGKMDSVLVDAPCSGLGTLRRHPDRRWRATPDEIPELAALGEALLRSAASLVKPGGFVVYSTCTVTRAENQCVVADFLASEQGRAFRTDPLNETEIGVLSRFITQEGWFRSVPEPGGADGHFVARLVREA